MEYTAKRPDFIRNALPDILHDGMLTCDRKTPAHSQRQKRETAFSGEEYPDEEITVPQPLVELLLQQAADSELPVEDIVMQSIRNYMERSENRGR